MTFMEMLRARQRKACSMLCVGLDSDYSQIPADQREGLPGFRGDEGV